MNEKVKSHCIDCGRETCGETCSICRMPICRQCIRDKKEALCQDCFYNDDVWMEDDKDYIF